jgi:GNAT superfamily N-acetyltransferase
MTNIEFHKVQPNDYVIASLIAGWYLVEWKIPLEKTINNLKLITKEQLQFQILMTVNGIPVSTGGIYHRVGLHEKEERFKIHKHWLALIYTIPEKRRLGYGASICKYIERHSKNIGIETIHLYTDTAVRLYNGLGWTTIENLNLGERNITVMKKNI